MVTKSISNDIKLASGTNMQNLMKKLKFIEEERLSTFRKWQYDESQNCSAAKMAEAGFFFTGNNNQDDDSASCFVCGKDLVRTFVASFHVFLQ